MIFGLVVPALNSPAIQLGSTEATFICEQLHYFWVGVLGFHPALV